MARKIWSLKVMKLQLTELKVETSKRIPLVIAEGQMPHLESTGFLEGRLLSSLEDAKREVDFWEWVDDTTLNQGNWLSLRVTTQESRRFCCQIRGSETSVSSNSVLDALRSATTVVGVTVEDEANIYITLVDGAGYGFTVKLNSWVDPAYERVKTKFGDITSSGTREDILNLIKTRTTGYELASEYVAWITSYCKLNNLRLKDFLESFAHFTEL